MDILGRFNLALIPGQGFRFIRGPQQPYPLRWLHGAVRGNGSPLISPEARNLARWRYWMARRFNTHARGCEFIRRVYPQAFL